MGDIEIKNFGKSKNKNLYRLTSKNKEIYIKIDNVRLPFNCQIYNKNLYLNIELFKNDNLYNENLNIIKSFENHIIQKLNLDKNFVSIIKDRKDKIHLKSMFKRQNDGLVLATKSKDGEFIDLDIFKLKDFHTIDLKYDIVLKPEIVWEMDDSYGITYYLVLIKNT